MVIGTVGKKYAKSRRPSKFSLIIKDFSGYSDQQRQLQLRKGVYLYEYMDKWKKLGEENLPPIAQVFSSLKQEKCSPEEDTFVQNVYPTG